MGKEQKKILRELDQQLDIFRTLEAYKNLHPEEAKLMDNARRKYNGINGTPKDGDEGVK